ncbi:hypothetical protein [Streptomonospora litoralis]|uniref:Uncharacterized protein n=1 Tax=Streptomonospora litoralis TaxID=2498135 RepID=A0A4V0ZJI0_9ACTN|nr:hypothetical protein [Streptomonospora litoralis]QBI53552.1 hypothetical protein EKD16_08790 [Streptomonospora litoralis]
MTFDAARQVADAVLLEGYLLYPYRASAAKNQVRWQFGVLAPEGSGTAEPAASTTECLVESVREGAALDLRLRFLRVRTRLGPTGSGAADADAPGHGGAEPGSSDDGPADWDEGELREIDASVALGDTPGRVEVPFALAAAEHTDDDGTRFREERLDGAIVVETEPIDGPYGLVRVRVRVENRTDWPDPDTPRPAMLRSSLVSAHTLLHVGGGASFVSLLEPPEWASAAVADCENTHTWPVLVGEPGRRDLMLSSPIILYDHPRIAAESPADMCDGTEIDEILTLRTMALTDEEKREARATDPRAARIIDHADTLPPELLDRLHGAMRYVEDAVGSSAARAAAPGANGAPAGPTEPTALDANGGPAGSPGPPPSTDAARAAPADAPPFDPPDAPWWDPGTDAAVSPEADAVAVAGGTAAKGSRVLLRPGRRRADAQDMFLAGRRAAVEGVYFDVDGGEYLAVTLEDDLGADLHQWHGRYLYFAPEEVELLDPRTQDAP